MNRRILLGVAMFLVGPGFSRTEEVDRYPQEAVGFAGMITGKVVAKGKDQLTVEVTGIEKVWKHSHAEKPESLVGHQVTIKVHPELYAKKEGYLARVRAFFGLLKVGETESFDVKHVEGAMVAFLELTRAQMERVEQAAL